MAEIARPVDARAALVTGGARNIGRAITLALAADGIDIAVNTRRPDDPDALALVEAVAAMGRRAITVLADVTDESAVKTMVGQVTAAFGRLDILVNNAAVRIATPFSDTSFDAWRAVVGPILDGAFLCTREALPHLLASGNGRIVNIGGQSGHTGAAGRAHVVTAKAGLVGLTKALAIEFAGTGLTANCVVPGAIDTDRSAHTGPSVGHIPPVGHRGRPEDIAAMVGLLCRPGSGYITGQSLHVNGGAYLP